MSADTEMTPTLELFGARTGNCFRAAIALEEASLPYSVTPVDLAKGEQREPRLLALNPAGQVPVLIDRSRRDPPLVLSQSNAILLHVAERSPGWLLPKDDPALRALTYERLFYFVTDVIAPNHGAFYLRRNGFAGGAPDSLEKYSRAGLQAAERFVSDAPFMAGSRFSVADIAAFTITLATEEHLDWSALPHLQRWFSSVRARPAVERGLRAFDPVRPPAY